MESIKKLDLNIRKTGQTNISGIVGKFTLGLVVLFCLTFVGCSKDAEINSFLTEWESVTNEIVRKIDANPSSAGIDEAQKTWDEKKVGLKGKWDNLKDARGFQVSKDTQKKMEESARKNVTALTDVMSKNMVKLAMDKSATDKFKKLMTDYGNTFNM